MYLGVRGRGPCAAHVFIWRMKKREASCLPPGGVACVLLPPQSLSWGAGWGEGCLGSREQTRLVQTLGLLPALLPGPPSWAFGRPGGTDLLCCLGGRSSHRPAAPKARACPGWSVGRWPRDSPSGRSTWRTRSRSMCWDWTEETSGQLLLCCVCVLM